MNNAYIKTGLFWDEYQTENHTSRIRWWQSPTIIKYCNYLICGKYLDGWNAGGIDFLKRKTNGKIFKKGISIGCGLATKEITLIESGVVEHFSCYELSSQSIEIARRNAEIRGIQEHISFHVEDFFASNENKEGNFDFVFWDNSLHHMIDVNHAVETSKKILMRGGVFFCNDYVGASRFQWSDLEIAFMNGIRLSMPETLFVTSNGKKILPFIQRPSLQEMINLDPSEAADSENIIPSITNIFKKQTIINLGGMVYHTVLNDVLQNIDEDSDYLKYLLALDGEALKHGFTQYAFVLAEKV